MDWDRVGEIILGIFVLSALLGVCYYIYIALA